MVIVLKAGGQIKKSILLICRHEGGVKRNGKITGLKSRGFKGCN